MSEFGDRLKEAREMRELTQNQLAVMCDTGEAIIRSYEKGRRTPSKAMMLRLFDALETPPDFFFQDELSFNPYESKNVFFHSIEALSPEDYELIKDFVRLLARRRSK